MAATDASTTATPVAIATLRPRCETHPSSRRGGALRPTNASNTEGTRAMAAATGRSMAPRPTASAAKHPAAAARGRTTRGGR